MIFIKYTTKLFLWLRWLYFHISPFYIKFGIDTEKHFQSTKTGNIHSNIKWKD